jgi:hypothetical protein
MITSILNVDETRMALAEKYANNVAAKHGTVRSAYWMPEVSVDGDYTYITIPLYDPQGKAYVMCSFLFVEDIMKIDISCFSRVIAGVDSIYSRFGITVSIEWDPNETRNALHALEGYE